MKKLILAVLLLNALVCFSQVTEVCNDNHDNDLDLLTDCADPDCTDPVCDQAYACSALSQLYQISGNQLLEWDGSSWSPVSGWTNPTGILINAMGYNVEDGFIYGIDPINNKLLRITKTGIQVLGDIPGTGVSGKNWHTGDMDLNGNLYVTALSLNKMIVVDVSAVTSQTNANISPVVNFNGVPNGQINVADWTYLPATGYLYGFLKSTDGMNSTIRVMDLSGNHINDIPFSINGLCNNSNFGAAFSDSQGHLYAFCNSGGFYEFTPNANFSSFTVSTITMPGVTISNNDGASCPLSNGLDDNNDNCCEQVLALLQAQSRQNASQENIREVRSEIESLKKEMDLPVETSVILHQNTPNPFDQQTVIKYEIMDKKARQASILIFDLNGNLKHTYPIAIERRGKLVIEAETLSSGMYIYTLIVNDKAIDSKRMILLN